MKKLNHLVAAVVFGVSGLASAAVPAKVDVFDSIKPGFDLDIFNFSVSGAEAGMYHASLDMLPKAGPAADVAFAIKRQGSSLFDIVAGKFGAGSFDFSATAGNYFAVVLGDNFSFKPARYHLTVDSISPVPEPETWAMLLLGLGLVVYQTARGARNNTVIRVA